MNDLFARGLRQVPSWVERGLAVALVMGFYLGVGGPARTLLARYVARPTLVYAASKGTRQAQVKGEAPVSVRLADGRSFRYTRPAGIRFLVAALFLAAWFPRRLWWLGLWGIHFAAGVAALGLLALALASESELAGNGYRLWTTTGLDVFSLIVPFWMWLYTRKGRFLPAKAEAPSG